MVRGKDFLNCLVEGKDPRRQALFLDPGSFCRPRVARPARERVMRLRGTMPAICPKCFASALNFKVIFAGDDVRAKWAS